MSKSSTFIPLALDLPVPLADEHGRFEDIFAVTTLEATAVDLKAGLALCRAAADSGEALQYSAIAQTLNQVLVAADCVNKCEGGTQTFQLIASWLALNPISVCLFLADVYKLNDGPAPHHFLQLRASFYAVLPQIHCAPAGRSASPRHNATLSARRPAARPGRYFLRLGPEPRARTQKSKKGGIMKSCSEFRAAGCDSKVSFAHKAQATVSRKHTNRTVYRCTFCSKWHVGNNNDSRHAAARAKTLLNIRALEVLPPTGN